MENSLTLFPAPLYGPLRPGCGWLQVREVTVHFWSCLGKMALGTRMAPVSGPHPLSGALTLPPEEKTESNGQERPWQGDLPSHDSGSDESQAGQKGQLKEDPA